MIQLTKRTPVYFCKYIYIFTFTTISQLCDAVYPETKGVPLEEMDAVFGEGMLYFFK